jgi:hypothetical protein
MKTKNIQLLIIALVPIFLSSCSVRHYAMRHLIGALSESSGSAFTNDDDPQLVGDALPFAIKAYETLCQKEPSNPELLLTTGKLLTLYAYAFVSLPADTFASSASPECKAGKKRAKNLFIRGRNYVLEGLEIRHRGISEAIENGPISDALAQTTASDTDYLYWAGASWASAIGAGRSDLGFAMTSKRALALLDRTIQLNDRYGNGAAHECLIPFCAGMPSSLGGGEKNAREHFEKAVRYSSGKNAKPYLLLATSVAIKNHNREEFVELLGKVLAVDCNDPSYKLLNNICIDRAQWLLKNMGRYFPPSPPDSSSAHHE